MIDQAIQSRLDAYRGNPQALAQRYQMSQDLLDLLALQKLKSEKEAAAREMQLQMAQQQGQPPTVAQQREQEVMNMTKQELAQQVGQVGQQQMQQQQAALQRMMGGLAAAPGAQNVMPEQAMAAGGIVAFQEGGTPEDMVARPGERELTEEEKEYLRMLEADETRRLMRRYPAEPARTRAEARERMQGPYYGPTPAEREAAAMRAPGGLPQILDRMRPQRPMAEQVKEVIAKVVEQPSTEQMEYFNPEKSSYDYVPYPTRGPMRIGVGGQAMPEDRGGGEAPAPREAPPVAAQPTAAPAAAQPAGLDALRTALARQRLSRADIEKEIEAQHPEYSKEEIDRMSARVKAAQDRAAQLQQGPGLMELLIAAAQGMAGKRRGREFEGSAAALSQLTASRRAEAEKAAEAARLQESGLMDLRMRQKMSKFGAIQGRMTEEQRAETARIGDAVKLAAADIQAAAQREIAEENRKFRELTAANASDTKIASNYNQLVTSKAQREQQIRTEIEKLKAEDMDVKLKKPGAEAKYDTQLAIRLQELDRLYTPVMRRYEAKLGLEIPEMPTRTAAPVNTQGFLLKNVR